MQLSEGQATAVKLPFVLVFFLTPGGRLAVPDTISDTELEARHLPRRYATEYFEYGKDKYWRGDDMVEHTVKVAIPIFNATFPNCQAVFFFDNASNHSSYAADALRVENMNLNPGGSRRVARRLYTRPRKITVHEVSSEIFQP